jgi:hypothetical protein
VTTGPGTSEDPEKGTPDEQPLEELEASAVPEVPEASEPAEAVTPPPPAARKGPLRGTGRGIGMVDEGGGGANELMRRVRDAANAARKAADDRRPAAERAVHEAAERARRVAEAARPEAERLARQAKAAAEAARPHVERAAREAGVYAREHEDELRNAATKAARFVAPAPLRPALDAMDNELRRSPAQEDDESKRSAEPESANPDEADSGAGSRDKQ